MNLGSIVASAMFIPGVSGYLEYLFLGQYALAIHELSMAFTRCFECKFDDLGCNVDVQ